MGVRRARKTRNAPKENTDVEAKHIHPDDIEDADEAEEIEEEGQAENDPITQIGHAIIEINNRITENAKAIVALEARLDNLPTSNNSSTNQINDVVNEIKYANTLKEINEMKAELEALEDSEYDQSRRSVLERRIAKRAGTVAT